MHVILCRLSLIDVDSHRRGIAVVSRDVQILLPLTAVAMTIPVRGVGKRRFVALNVLVEL